MIEKINLYGESNEKRFVVSFASFLYIVSYMFYVILISLLINLVLAPYLEPLYERFQNAGFCWNFDYFLGVILLTLIYMILNLSMSFLSYKTVFWKLSLREDGVKKFLIVVGLLFPIALFTFSFVTEGSFFPLILNSTTQILSVYFFRKRIKIS